MASEVMAVRPRRRPTANGIDYTARWVFNPDIAADRGGVCQCDPGSPRFTRLADQTVAIAPSSANDRPTGLARLTVWRPRIG